MGEGVLIGVLNNWSDLLRWLHQESVGFVDLKGQYMWIWIQGSEVLHLGGLTNMSCWDKVSVECLINVYPKIDSLLIGMKQIGNNQAVILTTVYTGCCACTF